jgi:hypothetical protein
LVQRRADAASQARTVATTRVAARALGLPERRAPRTSVQREHELLLARLVAELERAAGGPVVRTEREARSREAAGVARFSADMLEASGTQARRWPDLVLEGDGLRVAVEVELTGKGTARLERIVAGYRDALWFDEVRFLAGLRAGRAAPGRRTGRHPRPARARASSAPRAPRSASRPSRPCRPPSSPPSST